MLVILLSFKNWFTKKILSGSWFSQEKVEEYFGAEVSYVEQAELKAPLIAYVACKNCQIARNGLNKWR